MSIHFTQLGNGIRVVTEHIPSLQSVSLGCWLTKGARHEQAQENGMFHFIEHTLFKGTPKWNARQIAETFDGLGGSLDAYTGKEETCFSFRLRSKHLPLGLGILADMIQNPCFDAVELDRERKVILEEIKMAADDPEDLAFETAMQSCWEGHSLGRPILGPPENVKRFRAVDVRDFHRCHYQPEDLIVAAAGQLDHEDLCKQIESLFCGFRPPEPDHHAPLVPPTFKAFQAVINKPYLEQVSFCLVFPTISQTHPNKPDLVLLSTILGGGMSSRLFQTIREERGLAYHVGSFFGTYSDSGFLSVYGSCAPENLQEVLDLIGDALKKIKTETIPEPELERAKEQCIGGLVLGLESSFSRAGALAKAMQYRGEIFDLKREIDRWNAVSSSSIQVLANNWFQNDRMGLAVVGPVGQTPLEINVAQSRHGSLV